MGAEARIVVELSEWIASNQVVIACVLFDLDGTLRHNIPSGNHALIDQAVVLGVADGAEKRRRIARWTHYYWAQSPELADDLSAYPEETDFWRNYIVRSLLEYDCTQEVAHELAPVLERYMSEEYFPENVIPPDVHPTLHDLKKSGYRLGVVSNRHQPCHEELRSYGLDEFFELALVAGEVSAWKPDPALFTHALERLEITPEQAIYVGDNYYADVVGALRAGLGPVLYDPDEVFTDVDCPVIRNIGELRLLKSYRPDTNG